MPSVKHDSAAVSGATNNPSYDVSKTEYLRDHDLSGIVTDGPLQTQRQRRVLAEDGTWRIPGVVGTGVVTVGSISQIVDDGAYNAWPSIARMTDGKLLLAYTKGTTHHLDNTGHVIVRIGVEGLNGTITWGSEATAYTDATTKWSSVMGVGVSHTGRVFLTLWRDVWNSTPTGEAGLVYSDDNGVTWSAWVSLTAAFSQDSYGAGPVVELANGDLLVTIEGTDSGTIANRSSKTLRSTDNGLTWGSVITVRAYVTDTRPYYESKLLLLPNDTLLCFHRTSGGTGNIYLSTSTDGGLTWGVPVNIFAGYAAPSATLLSTGTIVVLSRRNSDAASVVYTSIDKGVTWAALTVLDATPYESEYGQIVELLDGRLLAVYGDQETSSTSDANINQVYVTETTHNQLDIPNDASKYLDGTGQYSTPAGAGAALTAVDGVMGGNVTMTNSNTLYDGPSASFAAGTWLIHWKAEIQGAGSPTNIYGVLWDGTTLYDESESLVATTGYRGLLSGFVKVVLGTTTTLKVSAQADTSGCTLKRDTSNASGTTHRATALTGIKIA